MKRVALLLTIALVLVGCAAAQSAPPPVSRLRVEERATLNAHVGWIAGMAISPNGRILASAGHESLIKLWDVATGKEIRTLTGHAKWVRWVLFTRDGKRLYSGSQDNDVKLWDVATGKCLATFTGHTAAIRNVVYSNDGKKIWSSSWDHTVKEWDVATQQEIRTLQGHTNHVRALALSPDNKTLASGAEDKQIILWDPDTGVARKSIRMPGIIHCLLFTPDGKVLIAGGDAGMLKLLDATTGDEIASLTGHTAVVLELGLSHNGRYLVSGCFDKTARLWNLKTRTQLAVMDGFEQGVRSAAITPDGKIVAAGSMNIIKLWSVKFK